MAQLFTIENRLVYPYPETLLISPFKEIWERDISEEKEIALEEFAYMEFMASMRKSNPFKGYAENKKEGIIIKAIITSPDWVPDTLIQKGIEEIKKFQTEASITYSYFLSVKKAVEEMQIFLNGVDLSERTKMGAPVYKPKELTSALIDTEKVLANLKALETKVEEELFESSKNRANKEVSPFADSDSFSR